MVGSWPTCGFCALVVAVAVLLDSLAARHRQPSVSMKTRSWLAEFPYWFGQEKK